LFNHRDCFWLALAITLIEIGRGIPLPKKGIWLHSTTNEAFMKIHFYKKTFSSVISVTDGGMS